MSSHVNTAALAGVSNPGILTASIVHEVNQPLSGVVTNAGTCLRMLAADPPNLRGAREAAQLAMRDGIRASEVIARLRSFYGGRGAPRESVDLNNVARDAVALSSGELHKNKVVLRLELAGDLPPITGDRVLLQDVILNLLRNASEAMSDVYHRARNLLVKTEKDESSHVRLIVRDAGGGFAPQTKESLFQPFFTTKRQGMGIGLSVSRSIIEGHRGRIWAESNVGPGATFAFSIPAALHVLKGARGSAAARFA
jgi:C4-dicarboxylate-specific signal transduction histidine kinase